MCVNENNIINVKQTSPSAAIFRAPSAAISRACSFPSRAMALTSAIQVAFPVRTRGGGGSIPPHVLAHVAALATSTNTTDMKRKLKLGLLVLRFTNGRHRSSACDSANESGFWQHVDAGGWCHHHHIGAWQWRHCWILRPIGQSR